MNNSGELCIIIENNDQLVSLPNELPSQNLTLTGYQLQFDTAANANTHGGLLYFQIDDYLSYSNVLDTNPTFTSIPLTYRLEATPVSISFSTDGIARSYKINRKLPTEFTIRLFNSSKVLVPSADIVRFVFYFSINQSQVFTG